MRKQRLSPEEIEQCRVEGRARGYRVVAEDIGCHMDTVRYHANPRFREQKLCVNLNLRNRTPRQIGNVCRKLPSRDYVMALLGDGVSQREVARRYDVSPAAVWRAIRRLPGG